jgi:PRTRC genetic system protein B
MEQALKQEFNGYQWALPESLELPPDELRARLDFYTDNTVLYLLDKGVITTRQVSAGDIALAVLSRITLNSGLLPREALWWKQDRVSAQFALWRPPKIWQVALQEEPFQPARRFRLPMPGLIFICSPGRAPAVYAAKKRPRSQGEYIYHAPLFNVYQNGTTCAGTARYPQELEKIPEAFFASFFTKEAFSRGRSQKYPDDLIRLWEEIDGKPRFPLEDLVKMGTVGDLLK